LWANLTVAHYFFSLENRKLERETAGIAAWCRQAPQNWTGSKQLKITSLMYPIVSSCFLSLHVYRVRQLHTCMSYTIPLMAGRTSVKTTSECEL
jgi:hypothetical protein